MADDDDIRCEDGSACPLAPEARDEDGAAGLDRRAFLKWAAGTSLGATGFFLLATLVQALMPPTRSIDGMTKVGRLVVARISDLEIGQPVMTDYGDDKIFLIKTSNTEVSAFDAACPHARCTLRFSERSNRFDCPCHGSAFTIEGRKIEGPTPRDMVPAVASIVNGDVVISGFGS